MRLLTSSLLLLTCVAIGGMAFKFSTPSQCNEILPDDSIFVLTGDMRRIPFAMRKLRTYPNTDLYIIGAGDDGSYEINRRVTIESESISKCIGNKKNCDTHWTGQDRFNYNRRPHESRASLDTT